MAHLPVSVAAVVVMPIPVGIPYDKRDLNE